MKDAKGFFCPITNKNYQLPPHLYSDVRKRRGRWRYNAGSKGIRLIENFAEFEGKELDAPTAIKIAEALNLKFHGLEPASKKLTKRKNNTEYFLKLYLKEVKQVSPKKYETSNFKDAVAIINKFCITYSDTGIEELTTADFRTWFNRLKFSQQKKCRKTMHRFVNFLDTYSDLAIKKNPFSNELGAVENKEKPEGRRVNLDFNDFKLILKSAQDDKPSEQWFTLALKLAYLLRLRRADLVNLKFDNIDEENGFIYCAISKSENQKGEEKAVILVFPLAVPAYAEAYELIKDAKKTRNINIGNNVFLPSAFVLHRKPNKIPKTIPDEKECLSQISKGYLSRRFAKHRDLFEEITKKAESSSADPATFHGIRGMAAKMDEDKGLSKKEISVSLAHSGLSVTNNSYLNRNIEKIEVASTLATLGDMS